MFDAMLNRETMLRKSGAEVHHILETMFPERRLYSHSIYWRKSDDYILKAKGTEGDVVVGWLDKKGGYGNEKHR